LALEAPPDRMQRDPQQSSQIAMRAVSVSELDGCLIPFHHFTYLPIAQLPRVSATGFHGRLQIVSQAKLPARSEGHGARKRSRIDRRPVGTRARPRSSVTACGRCARLLVAAHGFRPKAESVGPKRSSPLIEARTSSAKRICRDRSQCDGIDYTDRVSYGEINLR
jgi:hypothetical protein